MIGNIPLQIVISVGLYCILYLSIYTAVFAQCGSFGAGFRFMRHSAAVRREGIYIALFTGMVYTAVSVIGFIAVLENTDHLVPGLAVTAMPIVPAVIMVLILALTGAGKKVVKQYGDTTPGYNKSKRGLVAGRYALATGGVFVFVVLFFVFSRKTAGAYAFIGPVSLLVVLIGFGFGQLLWLLVRKKQPKDERNIYRPGFISTVLFFYSIFTSGSLFLLLDSSLDNPGDIGKWMAIFLQSTLYYEILFITLRGSRIRRFCRTGSWKGWEKSAWQVMIMSAAVIVLTILPYLFMAWFFR